MVYANDHRGHWKTAGVLEKAGIAGPDGWNGIIRDVRQLNEIIQKENPGLLVFFFGHSLGSLIAQQYIQNWGGELKGAILSGTFGSLGGDRAAIAAMGEQAAQAQGDDAPSPIFIGMFANFNQAFEPVKTGFEWLSRDEAEVQKYVDDPWCGFPFSNRLVIDMFEGAAGIWAPENEGRIPKDLSVGGLRRAGPGWSEHRFGEAAGGALPRLWHTGYHGQVLPAGAPRDSDHYEKVCNAGNE